MRRILFFSVYFPMVLLISTTFSSWASIADETAVEDLFKRHNIPKSMHREPMNYFLKRMEWQKAAALSNNWLEATQHPALARDNHDFSSLCFEYIFERRGNYSEHYIVLLGIERLPWIEDEVPYEMTSSICLNAKGEVLSFLNSSWALFFYGGDRPSEFVFVTNMKFPELEDRGGIEWDEKGKEIDNPYAKIGKPFWEDVYCEGEYYDQLKKTEPAKEPMATKGPENYELRVPDGKTDKNILDTLTSIYRHDKTVREGGLPALFEDAVFEKHRNADRQALFHFHKQSLARMFAYRLLGSDLYAGYFMKYDTDMRLTSYVSGQMSMPRLKKDKDGLPAIFLDGSGFEVTFHSNGFPATYKTVVDNRLFGLQIEWNEEGKNVKTENYKTPRQRQDLPANE